MIGMARLDPDRPGDLSFTQLDRDHVHGLNAFAVGHPRTRQDRVVPGQFRHGLRQLLEPSAVGELAIVDRGIAAQIDLQTVRIVASGGGASGRWRSHRREDTPWPRGSTPPVDRSSAYCAPNTA